MAKATRTLNPLHFEDLEPHRFEDLIRQLTYDFRPWKRLEPTGRLGADDGIDIRGVEVAFVEIPEMAEGDDEDNRPGTIERFWTIQCKREKSVHPADIKKIIKEAIPEGGQAPYGFILAAACDFSKKSRDTFIIELREWGVQEFYLWGKADLEDMLFQPKYDHLLFAYFGISLQIRRRSLKTEVRSKLATKKTLKRVLEADKSTHRKYMAVLDCTCEPLGHYREIDQFIEAKRLAICEVESFLPEVIIVSVALYAAYFEYDTGKWDAIVTNNCFVGKNEMIPWEVSHTLIPNTLNVEGVSLNEETGRIPKHNRAWLKVYKSISYSRIMAIDDCGFDWINGPHAYVEPSVSGLFEPWNHSALWSDDFDTCYVKNPIESDRIEFFHPELRHTPSQAGLQTNHDSNA